MNYTQLCKAFTDAVQDAKEASTRFGEHHPETEALRRRAQEYHMDLLAIERAGVMYGVKDIESYTKLN